MHRHAAQRSQLAADQPQLRLQQAVGIVHVVGGLFELLRQRFFRFAVYRQGLFVLQRRRHLVKAAGQLLRSAFEQFVAGIVGQAFTVRAEAGQVVEQGVREDQEAKAGLGIPAEVAGLQQHVRQRGRERRIGIVRVAPGQSIGQVVTLAALVLVHDLAQVVGAAAQGIGDHLVEATALPVRQDQEDCGGGDQAAQQGIDQAWPDQSVAIADLVETEQHQQRDGRRRQGVAAAAHGEEHDAGDHREQGLDLLAGKQVEQRPASDQAEDGAGHPLYQLDPRCAIVGLADEHGGQQHPVALFRVDRVQHRIAADQRQAHAQGVAKQQRGGRQLQADTVAGIAQRLRLAIQQAAVLLAFQGVGIARAGQLALHRREVARQGAQRTQQTAPGRVVLLAQVIERGFEVGQRLGIGLAVAKRLSQPDRTGQLAAGDTLQAQQAPAAKQHVAVEECLGQCLIGMVRGADALVQILGKKIQLEVMVDLHPRPTIAETMQQGFLGGVQGADHAPVLLRQLQALLLHVELVDRLEQRGLELEILPQLAIQPGQALLHRLMCEQSVPEHRQQAVPRCTGEQQQGVAPGVQHRTVALVGSDHAVNGEDQRGLGNGRVTLAQCAEHDQAEGRRRHAQREQPGVGKQQLYRHGGNAEAQQRHQQGRESSEPAVIGFRQGAGDDAEEQWDHHPWLIQIPAQPHAGRQCDQHPQAVTELVQRPEATQGVANRG